MILVEVIIVFVAKNLIIDLFLQDLGDLYPP